MAESDGRRRRPAVSCTLCRRRKIRCNRETPCSNCLRSRNGACIYENPQQHPQLRLGQAQTTTASRLNSRSRESIPIDTASSASGSTLPSHQSSSLFARSTGTSTATNQPSIQDDESIRLKLRIRQLEDELSKNTLSSAQPSTVTPQSDIQTTTSRLGGVYHVHCESDPSSQPQAIARGVSRKSRFFGQSHWEVNAILLVRDILETIETHVPNGASKVWSGMERCKSLARIIKARRAPPWPSPPTSDIPPKEISDTLFDCYLRTTESIYRILHIPIFRRDYDALWVSNPTPDTAFLVQLKLVLAIGAVTYDDQFSLRVSAIRWVYEAQTWLSEPKFKARLDARFLQTNLLLLIAQEQVGAGGDSTWISIGALLRKAVHMGLHRDPVHLPKRATFAAEMRRRLWNTILEIALQSSLASGGPPLISLDDFDTAPPGNFDDDQLVTEDPVPKAADEFTQVSIAIALRKTFPHRLAIAKFLNNITSSGTYEETLRLDAEFRAAYKTLGRSLQACISSSSTLSPSQFEIRVVDIIMHRFLSSLHLPYFGLALQQTTYAFSRRVVVESALKIWRAAYSCPSSTMDPRGREGPGPGSHESDDLVRLVVCSSGFYPTVAIHAVVLIGMELRAQLQEEESLGPVLLRPDLLSVLDEAKAWALRGIEVGETSNKGYLLISAISAHIEGLSRGLEKDEIAALLMKTAEAVVEKTLPMLEEMTAAQGQEMGGNGALDGLQQESLVTPVDAMEDWSFLTSNDLFDPGDDESMNWMFNDNMGSGVPSLW